MSMDNELSQYKPPATGSSASTIDEILTDPKEQGRWGWVLYPVAVLSMFEVTADANGVWAGTFRPGSVTALFLALIWLPYLLRVLAVAGGSFKLAGIEAKINGLVHKARQEGANSVIDAEDDALLEESSIQHLVAELAGVRSKPSGPERLLKQQQITAKIRAVALRDPPDIRHLFEQGSPEHRIGALVAAQVRRDPNQFDVILEGITKSESGFEQYEALRAARMTLNRLSPEQKSKLKKAVEQQRNEGHLKVGTERRALSDKILVSLNQ